MSEKAEMSKQKKIKIYIENSNNVNDKKVEIEINSDSTVFDLTKEVAKKFWAKKNKTNGYYAEFRLTWNHQLLNVGTFRDETINSLDVPIVDNSEIQITFYSANNINNNVFSWNILTKKEIEMLKQKPLSKGNKEENEKEDKELYDNSDGNQSLWLWPRIMLGVANLLLLVATITAFLLFFLTSLSFPIAVPIVLTVLFVVNTVLFLGGNNLLPKSWLGKIDLGTGFFGKNENRDTNKHKKNIKQEREYGKKKSELDL